MPTEISPTARALRAMDILQSRPAGVTADELAGRLGVTERAVRRYVGILREAGVPVDSIRGPHGGYRLGRGTRLPPVVFTQPEALGLVMAVLDSHSAAAETAGDDLVGTALGKVIRALPPSIGQQAAALREHASAAPEAADSARPDPLTTSGLVAAVADRRRVLITYRGEAGKEWESKVDPWAIVVRHGRWYLLCHSHHSNAVRTYRVDRIRALQQSTEHFVPPDDLDPVATVEANMGLGWRYTTHVVFDAPLKEVAPWVRPPMGKLGPAASGNGCVLVGSTRNPAMYAQEWLSVIPFAFRVEGGDELRAAVAEVAARFTAAVAEPAANSPDH